jgi:hypothetical protein
MNMHIEDYASTSQSTGRQKAAAGDRRVMRSFVLSNVYGTARNLRLPSQKD